MIAIHRQPMLIGYHRVPMRQRTGDAGMSERVIAGIALEVSAHPGTQDFIDFTGLRQRQFDQRHSERALEYGFVGENQHPFDLPLHFRLEVQRQIGADAPCGRDMPRGKQHAADDERIAHFARHSGVERMPGRWSDHGISWINRRRGAFESQSRRVRSARCPCRE